MKLLIGSVVRQRAWVLPYWFKHVEMACKNVGITPSYVFVSDPVDRETQAVIDDFQCFRRHVDQVFVEEDQTPFPERMMIDGDVLINNNWNEQRYVHMAWLRNQLLGKVRELEPETFLSIDSDILAAPAALQPMIDGLQRFDAVGGKLYMTPHGTDCPSMGFFEQNSEAIYRFDSVGTISVDVIMAMKLMSPKAYGIDYAPHPKGEDVGFSRNCKQVGVKLGWAGDVVNKHVMTKSMLDTVDRRCGF